MAPASPLPDSVFFPPLDKCLSGDSLLLSWKTVYEALCDAGSDQSNTVLRSFLLDETTIEILGHPLDPFEGPSAQSKASFQTKTAAINVTPSGNGHYDIEELKGDAVWLSDQTWIDELSTLRLVILEWQTRPAAQLLSGLTEEETLSVRDAAGGASFGASRFLPASSILAGSAGPAAEGLAGFASKDERRLRLLKLFLSEKTHILRVAEILTRTYAYRDPGDAAGLTAGVDEWLVEAGAFVFLGPETIGMHERNPIVFIDRCIVGLQRRLEKLEKGSGWYEPEGGNPEIEVLWGSSQVLEAIHILQLAFTQLDKMDGIPPARTVLAWFRFATRHAFCSGLTTPISSQRAAIEIFQAVFAAVSLVMLKLPRVMDYFDTALDTATVTEPAPYVTSPKCVGEITSIFIDAVQLGPGPAIPAAFAWSLVLLSVRDVARILRNDREHQISQDESAGSPSSGRRFSTTPGPHPFEEAMELIRDNDLDEDPIRFLGRNVLGTCGVMNLVEWIASNLSDAFRSELDHTLAVHIRLVFLELVREGLAQTGYVDASDAVIVLLSGDRHYFDLVDQSLGESVDVAVKTFLQDADVLVPQVYGQAVLRYPRDATPFVRMFAVIAQTAEANDDGTLKTTATLERMETLTQVMPRGFRQYSLIREDENANYICLTEDLPLFTRQRADQRRLGYGQEDREEEMVIRRGTQGLVNAETSIHTTTWDHPHSALQYLAHLLSTVVGDDLYEYHNNSQSTVAVAAHVVNLVSTLLASSTKIDASTGGSMHAESAARRLLVHSSEGLQNQDLVGLIFNIFEQELQRQCKEPGLEDSLALLVNCAHFIHALVAVLPERVWPFLSRSRLLAADGSGGALATIVTGAEMVLGQYHFLISCIRLFEALVDDAIALVVVRRGATSKRPTRFVSTTTATSGSPEKIMSQTVLSFEKILMAIFESSIQWRFSRIDDKLEINNRILGVFSTVLKYVYGFDDNPDTSKKLSGVLAPAAEYLIDIFLSTASNDLPIQPILQALFSGTETSFATLFAAQTQALVAQTHAALTFSADLLRAAMFLDRPGTYLQQKLFKACPILTRLFAVGESYKSSIVKLLETMVRIAGQTAEKPASLLGHLGPETAKAFLSILSNLSRPFENNEVEADMWRLLSAVVSCKQQWLSIYLLTGTTPRESFKEDKANLTNLRGKPLLSVALDQLCTLGQPHVDPEAALPMLEFVSLAQNHWPWAMKDLRDHKEFLKSLTTFLSKLSSDDSRPKPDQTLASCKKLHVASFVAEILAMYLHHARQVNDLSILKDLIPALGYLREHGAAVPYYNHSLHANLNRNFAAKYPSCNLANFKRTFFMPQEFGETYFYDIDFVSKTMGFDPSWGRSDKKGFESEVKIANLNLSLVEAQVNLLKSWKLLALELSNMLAPEQALTKLLAGVVEACLKANSSSNHPEELFHQLIHVRADFAFMVMQKLVEANINSSDTRGIFSLTWETIRASTESFDSFYSGDMADYHRTLLRILLLALHPHLVLDPAPSPPTKNGIPALKHAVPEFRHELEYVVDGIVAKGFRSLATLLHEDPTACSAADFVLLTAILQTILRVPGVSIMHADLALNLAANNTARYATSLFSWSHHLTSPPANDPIFGELSILFLLALSSMPVMAESLAVEGVLAQLNTATLTNYFRRPGGAGPFDAPARMHSIWIRGLLPLCLNLLHAVEGPIAAEIAAFLNQFPRQLARAATAFTPVQRRGAAVAGSPLSTSSSAGLITLGLASEAHSLALIHRVLVTLREAGPAAGAAGAGPGGDEAIPLLDWDTHAVRVDVEGLLQGRRALRERIVPTTEKETEMARAKPLAGEGKGLENRLEERVVLELEAALECLNGVGGNGRNGA